MHYMYDNQEGINAIDRLKDRGFPVEDLGAVEGRIDKTLANPFQREADEMRHTKGSKSGQGRGKDSK